MNESELNLNVGSIEKILSLNHDPVENVPSVQETNPNGLISQTTAIFNDNGEPVWKVLVFDKMGMDIISSVLRVNDLRGRGVTIHLSV